MKKFDSAFPWFLGYIGAYMIALKVVPVTAGAFTLALLFVLIIENLSVFFMRILKVRRWLAVIVSSAIFYGIMSYAIYSVVPILVEQGQGVMGFISDFLSKKPQDIFPKVENEEMAQAFKAAMDRIGEMFMNMGEGILKFLISKIPDLLTSTLLLIVSSTYLVIVLPNLKRAIPYMFPKSSLDRTTNFIRRMYSDMKKFVGGQMINAFLVGVIVWLGMWISGIKYAGFLGILSGITDFIPFLGVIIAALPALFLGITQYGIWGIVKVLIVLTIANQVESWILAPKVLGDRVRLNWFVVLVTMLAFSELYGVIGVLISVPFLVVARDLWKEYVVDHLRNT